MTDAEREAIQTFVDTAMGAVVAPPSGEGITCHCFNCRIYRGYARLKSECPWVK